MKRFFFLFCGVVSCALINFYASFALAQEGTPSATPMMTPQPTQNPVFETPIPTPATPVPVASVFIPTPQPVATPNIVIPETIILPVPTLIPQPSRTPRPTLPIIFQITTPTPSSSPNPSISPFMRGGTSPEYLPAISPYRLIVVPTLSFVTQTDASEFYKDQALPKHTADLLYLIAATLTVFGALLYFEESFITNIKRLRQKEYVQYINR